MNSLLDTLSAHGIDLTHLLLFTIFIVLAWVVLLLIQIKEYVDDTKASLNRLNFLSEANNHRSCDVNQTLDKGLASINRHLSDIKSQGVAIKYPDIDS